MAESPTDRQAEFVRLLSRHSSQIYGFILMLSVSHHDADDIFQETSVVLWQKFATYESGTSFKAWACKVAYYVVLTHRRGKSRLTFLSDSAISILANDAMNILQSDDEHREALADCLERLAASDRGLIEERYFVRMSAEEIAKRSSRSIHSVYRALSRVHGLLLRCIRRDLSPSNGAS